MMAHTLQWQDLFVVIDDGHVTIAEYQKLEPLVRAQAAREAKGLGCLVIIPQNAAPPPGAVRDHLQQMLARLPIRALGYVVEGEGFRAATVRGVLLGLGVFQRTAYKTKVFTSTSTALRWILAGGAAQVDAADRVINQARQL